MPNPPLAPDAARESIGKQLVAWGLLVATLLVAVLGLAPAEVGDEPLASGYDPVRARETLARLASEPHPTGSLAQGFVREYLIETIKAAGVTVASVAGEDSGPTLEFQAGELRGHYLMNLVVRLPANVGPHAGAPGLAVLLMAHYDTVPGSPGAGDDSSGVVALLESLHALVDAERRNDVLLLFTDGEERGLLGARLFAAEHALFEAVDVVLNFEAIGNGGPLLMFETGPGSGGLIELWADSTPHPIGNSLAAVIYGWMPNDTDLSVFRDRGKRGLNFAIAGASGFYHQPEDTPEAFDPRSLAHMGDTAVRLASALAGADLAALDREPRAFVGAPPFGAFVWGSRWHAWAALLALVLVVVAIARRGCVGPLGALRGVLGSAAQLLLSGSLAWCVVWLALAVSAAEPPIRYAGINLLVALLMVGAAVGNWLIVWLWTRGPNGKRCARELLVGALALWSPVFLFFFWIELGALGVAYPFAIASLGLAAATGLRLLRGSSALVAALVLVPGVFLLGPIPFQLVQLASRDLALAHGLGAALVALGAPLLTVVLLPGRALADAAVGTRPTSGG